MKRAGDLCRVWCLEAAGYDVDEGVGESLGAGEKEGRNWDFYFYFYF